MRYRSVLLVAALAGAASAEEPPPGSSIRDLSASPAPMVSAPLTPARLAVPPRLVTRWHRGRAAYTVGAVTGLLGTGLTLSSVIVVAVTGYPCNPNDPIHQINPNDSCNRNSSHYDPPRPTDAAPLLAYLGSSASALGFILSASGLGVQHSVLRELGADTPRGLLHGGTALGLLGFLSVGASYFFGFTDYLNPHDQGIAILATTVSGAALCAVGSLLFSVDASRTKKAWLGLAF
jgi:hypothetical protein